MSSKSRIPMRRSGVFERWSQLLCACASTLPMKKNRSARMKRNIPVLSAVRFVEPMAAALVDALPTGDEWLYEAKFDGYRALTLKDGPSVKILSRKGNDLTANYPAIKKAVAALEAKSAV